MPIDPRDDLRHTQSPIVPYTKQDAECGQQVTVVGRLKMCTTIDSHVIQRHLIYIAIVTSGMQQ